ncbi:hypothetical protein IJI70_00995 [Candidatus Saccharibacteria bacterium]|nr:hypothetical protein [Candidatus Saccharibacteria bacterium]
MPQFFIKKLFKKPKDFNPAETSFVSEKSFIEEQRDEALEVLLPLYRNWWETWEKTKNSLGDLNLTKEDLRRITYYETEQRKSVISLLADILVDWEKENLTNFGEDVVKLAKEMRPSLPYVEYDSNNFELSPTQLLKLRDFVSLEANAVKEAVRDLQSLQWKKFDFGEAVISKTAAEELLEERLGITWFEFLDFKGDVEFTDGYFPALLQQATDDGMNI